MTLCCYRWRRWGTRKATGPRAASGFDGWVWRAGGAPSAPQAGGARTPAHCRAGPSAHRVAPAAPARDRAWAKRVRGGASPRAARATRASPQAGDSPAGSGRGRGQAAGGRAGLVDRVRGLRPLPVRGVCTTSTATAALAVRLVSVLSRGVRGLRVVHVLCEGTDVSLRRRGRGRRAARRGGRVRAAGLRGLASAGAALPVAVLATARLRGGGPGAVLPLPQVRLPLPRAPPRPLQYYLVAAARRCPPHHGTNLVNIVV